LAQPRHLRYFLPAGLSRFEETRMADKRTTPDLAVGARRRKGPAPTIDLTATEVAAESAESHVAAGEPQAGSPPRQEAHEQPEADSEPANGRNGTSRKQGTAWQVLLAGFAGAAIMTAVLSALWSAGLVPARYDGSISPVPASIAALNGRMAKLEAAAKTSGSDPTVSERLSAADNAMKSLGIALTALTKRSDEAVGTAADARTRADASEKAMTELRNSVQDLSRNASAGLSPADVDSVKKRIAALEQVVKAAPADSAARLALSAAALRDTVASGASFVAELEEAKSLGADEKILAPLVPFAASGVPTIAALAQELRALIPAMQKASGAHAPIGGFLERLGANAGKLVRIRPVDAPPGNDSSAVLARVEIEAAHAAIDDALTDLGKLDAATRAPALDWIRKAQARQAALAAARQFASETTHALGKR
jgi:hypothetical protein